MKPAKKKFSIPPNTRLGWKKIWLCLALAGMTLAVFLPVGKFEFINYDDNYFVYENTHLENGLTGNAVRWAFTAGIAKGTTDADYWRPLSFLSHGLDVELFGLNPGPHHLMSLAIHIACVLVLFLTLEGMTRALWSSAFVAAVFAIHPLHIESLAWIAERKDVLSGLFFLLALAAYTRHARGEFSTKRYLLVLLLFGLALMCKPMVVTLPFVLLLLDYWPLKRFQVVKPWWRLVVEKIPLFALSAAVAWVTAHGPGYGTKQMESLSLTTRLGNATVSCATYLWQTVWPTKLAVFYPYPVKGLPYWEIILAALVLATISLAAFYWRRTFPFLLVGWLWFLGMLIPVIGIIQSGSQARADRYTYLPQIGLCIMFTWIVAELSGTRPKRRWMMSVGAAIILVGLGLCARKQVSYWRNSEVLWKHCLDVTAGNSEAHYNLGNAFFQKGQMDEAVVQYQQALAINPKDHDAHNNLGNVFFHQGRYADAAAHLQTALNLNPADTDALVNLGNVYFQQGEIDAAIQSYQRALAIKPEIAEAHNNLGSAFFQMGRQKEAVQHLENALALKPRYVSALNNLAWLLATSPDASIRNGPKAVEYAQMAGQVSGGDDPVILRTLAAAYAEAGQFSEALAAAQKGLQLAAQQNNPQLATTIQFQIKYYEAGIPYREK